VTPSDAPQTIELKSAHDFRETLARLTTALESSGMTIFARIDHQAGATQVGLEMPPTTVLLYGNPRGGTPLMLSAPTLALDLPLRVLIREAEAGVTVVSFHPAVTLTRAAGLQDERATGLAKAEALIEGALRA
jgi:uncharacterized protein (DUF302 family)